MQSTPSNIAAIVIFVVVFSTGQVYANTGADARTLFDQGVTLFQAGKPEQARYQLLAARQAGWRSPALAYNLGVVNYQLGRYGDAAREFRSLLDTPHRDLARYNLALIALAHEDTAQARKIFTNLAERAQNDKIRSLAARQLSRLPDESSHRQGPRYSSGLVLIGAGHDSNVDQLPESAASGAGEAYTDALVTVESVHATPANVPGVWSWEGVGYHQHFPGDKGSNLSLLEAGAGWESRRLGVNGAVHGFTRHWWLASDRVESQYGIRTSAWGNACGLLGRCYAELSLARVFGGDNYPEYDGWQYDLETGFRKDRWGGLLGLELGLSVGDREDIRDPAYSASVSPFRKRIELSWRRAIATGFTVTAETAYRHSDYQGEYCWQTDGGYVDVKREDKRWSAALQFDWQATSDWLITSEVRYETSDSSLDGYGYDRYNLWLGAGRRF